MAKYLLTGCYTAEGLRGLRKDKASGRRQAVSSMIEALGGRVEGFYYALGDDDVFVILDLPNHVKAAAVGVAVSATGLVRTKFTSLLTVEETDQALADSVSYRPPGG